MRSWLIIVALALDIIGGAALAIADLATFTLWWPLLAVVAFALLFVGSFAAFAQERAKNEPSLRLRLSRPLGYVMHFYIYPGWEIVQHIVRVHWRFLNHGDELRINRMWVMWRARISMKVWERRIPCRKVTTQSAHLNADQLDIVLPRASQSEELWVDFEESLRPSANEYLPLRSSYFLHVDVIGGPGLVVKLADFDVKSWEVCGQPLPVEPINALPTLDRAGSFIESA